MSTGDKPQGLSAADLEVAVARLRDGFDFDEEEAALSTLLAALRKEREEAERLRGIVEVYASELEQGGPVSGAVAARRLRAALDLPLTEEQQREAREQALRVARGEETP